MPPFPKGPKELAKAGYIYLKDGVCKAEGCGALLHWYKHSSRRAKSFPVDSITQDLHFKCCVAASRFSKKKKMVKPQPDPQLNMFAPKLMREPGEDSDATRIQEATVRRNARAPGMVSG